MRTFPSGLRAKTEIFFLFSKANVEDLLLRESQDKIEIWASKSLLDQIKS